MKTLILKLTEEEFWLLSAWRSRLDNAEKKTKTPEGQALIPLLNKILKAVEGVK